MAQEQPLIFHVGLYKTASSYLQWQIFPQVDALGTGPQPARVKALKTRMVQLFRRRSPSVWRTRKGRATAAEIAALARDDRPVLYSHESLYHGKIFLQGERRLQVRDPVHLLAAHLSAFARHAWGGRGSVRCLFFVRNQPDWLASMYAQFNDKVPGSGQADFERRVDALLADPPARGGQVVAYDHWVVTLAQALGEDAVLPLLYERLQEPQTWTRLAAFTERPELSCTDTADTPPGEQAKVRRSSPDAWRLKRPAVGRISRQGRKLLRRAGLPVQVPKAETSEASLVMDAALRQRIQTAYAASNRRFERLTGEEWAGRGYYPAPGNTASAPGT